MESLLRVVKFQLFGGKEPELNNEDVMDIYEIDYKDAKLHDCEVLYTEQEYSSTKDTVIFVDMKDMSKMYHIILCLYGYIYMLINLNV